MLLDLFIIGSIWFWLLSGVWFIALVIFLDCEKGTQATLTMIAFFAALVLLGDFNPLPWMKLHALESIALVVGYFAAGAAWSFVKWYFYVLRIKDRVQEAKTKFLERSKITDGKIPDSHKARWKEILNSEFGYRRRSLPPKATENKSRILMWMSYWPFSAVWTLINDPVKRAFEYLYARLSGLMQKISDHIFKDLKADLQDLDD